MREIKFRIALTLLVFFTFYLITSFVKLSFNIALWTEQARFVMVVLSLFVSVLVNAVIETKDIN